MPAPDKDAPLEVKEAMRLHLTQTFGPAGNLEQDGRRLRAFYARWKMMMKAENWSEVDLKTKFF